MGTENGPIHRPTFKIPAVLTSIISLSNTFISYGVRSGAVIIIQLEPSVEDYLVSIYYIRINLLPDICKEVITESREWKGMDYLSEKFL